MSEKKKQRRLRRRQLKKKFFTQNRLVVVNEETLEEVFSLRLTLINVFVVATLGAVLIIFVTTYIIAFTPLREYIPGYASTELKRNATQLAIKSDSLTTVLRNNEAYLTSVKEVLTGNVDFAQLDKDSITPEPQQITAASGPSEREIELRNEVEREDKYNLFEQAKTSGALVFFPPLKGIVLKKFNITRKQFAVEVAVPKNTPVKAVSAGNVIFADWTPTNGNVLILRHGNGFLSVYKQVATLNKRQGDPVKSGEVIALAGTAYSESTGISVAFELWKDGYPVDPLHFISFD